MVGTTVALMVILMATTIIKMVTLSNMNNMNNLTNGNNDASNLFGGIRNGFKNLNGMGTFGNLNKAQN